MRHLLGEACFLNGGDGIATTDDRAATFTANFSQRCGDAIGAGSKFVELEHAPGAVPDHGFAISQGRLEHFEGIGADVETHPAIGDRCDVCDLAVGIWGEVVR